MTDFERFYAAYFRHDARKDALKAWGQVKGSEHLAAILEALAWQTPLYLAKERQYRPLPATWLRGERWTDEHPEVERQRLVAARPKPAWYDQAMQAAVDRQKAQAS